MNRLTFRTGMGDELLDAIAFLNPDDEEGMYNLRDIGKHGSDELLLEIANRLAEYEDAEEQGLLVRLPCKVGDRMYFLDTCHTAEDFGKKFVSWGEVTKVSIAGMYVCLKTPTGLPLALSWETIFTTREEAEKAMKNA